MVNDEEYEPIVIDVRAAAERMGLAGYVRSRSYEPDALQRQCLKTWVGGDFDEQHIHAVLGLNGEAGELSNLLKKHFFKTGHLLPRAAVMDELSDVLYYVAIMAHLWEFTIDDMAAHLREKLADGHGWTE